MPGRNDPKRGVAHLLDRRVVGELTRSQDLHLGRIEPAFGDRLAERGGLRAGGNEHENRFRVQVLGALHIGREVGIGDRHAHRADDLAAGGLERAMKSAFGIMTRAIVRHHRVGLLDAALGRPGPERFRNHRKRQRDADAILGFGSDDRGRGIHDHHHLLRFFGDIACRERVRRQHEARQDVDLVADDEFLRQTLGDVRRDATDILADDFDLLARDRVAVLLHVKLDAVVDLVRRVGELARIGQDDADLHAALRIRRADAEQQRERARRE